MYLGRFPIEKAHFFVFCTERPGAVLGDPTLIYYRIVAQREYFQVLITNAPDNPYLGRKPILKVPTFIKIPFFTGLP